MLDGFPYVWPVEVRFRDLDALGHVNNAVFLTYLEEARDEFYTNLPPSDTVHRMVLRHATIDFRRSLVQSDDHVEVTLRVLRLGTSSVVTEETITSVATGEIAAVGESVMVHCDPARERAEPFSDEARALLEAQL